MSTPDGSPISRPRLDSVDLLRGVVMALMALDHVRATFSNASFDPTDLSKTDAAYFLTRWITHFCAPVFVFLAGTSAFLSGTRGKSRTQLSWLLLTRGLWLALLDLLIVPLVYFTISTHEFVAGVIWVIGWSMVVLAGLIFLPVNAVTLLGLLIIGGHNAFDLVQPADLGGLSWLWTILHVQGWIEPVSGFRIFTFYPLLPWIGVMATGYGFGALLRRDPASPQREVWRLGLAAILFFVVIRATNWYGDPSLWTVQSSPLFTILSFINCTKYPPSLLFLLMTLGPALLCFRFLDNWTGKIRNFLVVFGRVPLFYYFTHLLLIHALFVGLGLTLYGQQLADILSDNVPEAYRYTLPVVYLVWLVVLVALFPACRWYAGVKQRYPSKWFTYL